MSALSWLVAHPDLPHPNLEVVLTSDEEIGRGTESFPFGSVKSKVAYTLDGGEEGGIESECYNAYQAKVAFVAARFIPGDARGKLVNARHHGQPICEPSPLETKVPKPPTAVFGCLWAHDIQGGIETATVTVVIRDFDRAVADRRVASLQALRRRRRGRLSRWKGEC